MDVVYAEEPDLDVDEFLDLAQHVWPGDYSRKGAADALRHTIKITARVGQRLVGCVRILCEVKGLHATPQAFVKEYQVTSRRDSPR